MRIRGVKMMGSDFGVHTRRIHVCLAADEEPLLWKRLQGLGCWGLEFWAWASQLRVHMRKKMLRVEHLVLQSYKKYGSNVGLPASTT